MLTKELIQALDEPSGATMDNKDSTDISGYRYESAKMGCTSAYVLPAVLRELDRIRSGLPSGETRLFEVGCGNGGNANALAQRGWNVSGVDVSITGIANANAHYPHLNLLEGSAYEDLAARFGTFPLVISLEVVEHLYFPRRFAKTIFSLLAPGGAAIVSTPYHGYLKNLALAVSGKLDDHFTALWDHGHIKFWSATTLRELLLEAGFADLRLVRVGRIPWFAKSMIVIATRPF